MSKAREGASQLLSNLSPRTPFGMRVRRQWLIEEKRFEKEQLIECRDNLDEEEMFVLVRKRKNGGGKRELKEGRRNV